MKKFKNLVIGGIENKIFNLILATILLVSAAFVAVTLYHQRMLTGLVEETSSRQREAIGAITDNVMEQVVDSSMDRTTELEALIINELFNGLKTRVEMLGDYAGKLFAAPEEAPRAAFEGPDLRKDGKVTAQMILAEGVREETVADRMGLAANMSDMMISLYGVSEGINSCFIALPEGALLVVDDRSASKFDERGNPVSFNPQIRPWYKLVVEKEGLIFTDVMVDAFTGEIGIVCAMPVYVDGRLEAVVGADLFLTSMQEQVQNSEENGSFVCIVNQNGHVVFSPRSEGLLKVVPQNLAQDIRESENEELAGLVEDALQGKTDVRTVGLVDGSYYMMGAPMETVGWAILSALREDVAAQPTVLLQDSYRQIEADAQTLYLGESGKSSRMILILMILLLALLGGSAIFLGKRIVKPLNTIITRISELREGNLEFQMEDTYKTGDEIEVLAESFVRISHKTVQYVDEVRRVTAEKERIGTELHMANQIQESMLPSIFPAFPDRPEFDIYATMNPAKEVGGDFYDFFLIDEDHLCLVMADVSGKGVPAALFMMVSKVIVQSCAMLGKSAAEILAKTNEALCSNNQVEMFVTIWLGILEISTGRLTAANAGHEYPISRDPGGNFHVYKDKHGFVVGGMSGVKYKEYEIQMEPGSKLFLYTDGVPEATDEAEKMYGMDRLVEALNREPEASPVTLLKNVREDVDSFVDEAEQFDDMTMMCLEYRGGGGVQ